MHVRVVDEPVCQTVDQPGDQACRVPTDSVHRQSCCRDACGDAAKGPPDSDCIEDSGNSDQLGDQACRVPTDSLHRQSYCRDSCGDAENGPLVSDCIEDSGNPASEVRRQSCGGACDHADAPVPPVALKERISARIHEQTADQPGKTADAVRRQSCGSVGTVTGDDVEELHH